jgi:hypothetical protein
MHLVFISNVQIPEELVPFLTLIVTPTMPTIPDDTPLGTPIAVLQGVWSNGDPFTGSFMFVAPNFDDGGIYDISGNLLRVSPTGPGVGSEGGSIDFVTIVAIQ